ncbi:MAG: tRNA (adenosine(37)-N6)-threonylcarbamoyltransferase complex ATPase subunit type 1 TsaE [Solirubrobacteraceae bacterium]|nr:tRNA (adenosine(37)-N6)-threonylcarbamoyltransferase complex ATPase subunit type 1 TsaE [Solirubrobacteraceae bacterium]
MNLDVVSRSPEQTAALATAFAAELNVGDLVLLEGDLGAGKTTFARALCQALGVDGPVTSPTFGVAHRYDARIGRIAHLDLHRLGELGAFDRDLVDDELDDADLGLVEWPSGAPGLEDRATWRVQLGHASPSERTVRIESLSEATR